MPSTLISHLFQRHVPVMAWALIAAYAMAGGKVLLEVQDSPLAGSQFHDLALCLPEIEVGAPLRLEREPSNPHDVMAVRVYWQSCFLGYVPRKENRAVAHALDRGEPLTARVTRLTNDRNPWLRLRFAVFAEL